MVNVKLGPYHSKSFMCLMHVNALSVHNGSRIKMGSDLNKYIAVLPNYDKLTPAGRGLVSKYFNKEVFHKNFGGGEVVGFEIAKMRVGQNLEASNFSSFIIVKFKKYSEQKKLLLERADKFLEITGEKKYREPTKSKVLKDIEDEGTIEPPIDPILPDLSKKLYFGMSAEWAKAGMPYKAACKYAFDEYLMKILPDPILNNTITVKNLLRAALNSNGEFKKASEIKDEKLRLEEKGRVFEKIIMKYVHAGSERKMGGHLEFFLKHAKLARLFTESRLRKLPRSSMENVLPDYLRSPEEIRNDHCSKVLYFDPDMRKIFNEGIINPSKIIKRYWEKRWAKKQTLIEDALKVLNSKIPGLLESEKMENLDERKKTQRSLIRKFLTGNSRWKQECIFGKNGFRWLFRKDCKHGISYLNDPITPVEIIRLAKPELKYFARSFIAEVRNSQEAQGST